MGLIGIIGEVLARLTGDSPLPKVWPMITAFMSRRGFAIHKEPVPIACFAHAINGGLKIDVSGRTTILGMYSAGAIAEGAHGADRLGGEYADYICKRSSRKGGSRLNRFLMFSAFIKTYCNKKAEMSMNLSH